MQRPRAEHANRTTRARLALVFCACVAVTLSWPQHARAEALDDSADVADVLEGFDEADAEDDVETALDGFDAPSEQSQAGELDDDDVLSGFDDAAPTEFGLAPAIETDRFWEVSGSVSLGASINVVPHRSSLGPDPDDPFAGTDYLGVQRFRTRGDLTIDVDLPLDWELRAQGFLWYDWAYLMYGRENYTDAVLSDYEFVAEVLDLWVAGTLFDKLDLKLGRQVVNWGRSDTLRVTDVLNALDNREPGLGEIENLRLPSTMLRADYFIGRWSFTALVVPEIRYDINPPAGSDFFVLPNFGDLPPPLPPLTLDDFLSMLDPNDLADLDFTDRRAKQWGANPEYGGAIEGVFSGWDVSFYVARIYQNRSTFTPGLPGSPLASVIEHDRVTMVGGGGNYTWGSWLFKAELAWFGGVDYIYVQPVPPPDVYAIERYESGRVDFMGGVEYYGFVDTTVALEIVNRHIIDYQPLLGYFPSYADRNSVEYSLRVSTDWMNARLRTTLLAIVLGATANQGAIMRGQVDYDLFDALVVSGGFVGYIPGNTPPLDAWGKNQRAFLKIKYSF